MKILVASRDSVSYNIQKHKKENPTCRIISICITDPKSDLVNIPLDKSDILRLQFHDLDGKYPSSGPAIILFNQYMAQQIKTFVEQRLCGNLITFVSCEAGISRSSGVAGALAKYFLGNDDVFFRSPYLPNRFVYRTLLNILNGQENTVPNVIIDRDFEDNDIFG